MLLKRIVQLQLLPTEELPAAHPVSAFPTDSKRRIIAECVAANPSAPSRELVALLGCVYELPLEDVKLMGQATHLLLQWLQHPTIDSSLTHGEILLELSGAFEVPLNVNSKKRPAEQSKHVDLGQTILRQFLKCTADLRTLHAVLIAACDNALSQTLLPYCYLSEELGEQLLSTLIEVLLRDECTDTQLWTSIGSRLGSWLQRSQIALLYGQLLQALTARLIEPQVMWHHVSLAAKGHVSFLWFQMVRSLTTDDLLNLPAKSSFIVANELSKAVNSPALSVVDANGLMEIFGPALVALCRHPSPETKAIALGALCAVFGEHQSDRSVILPDYLHVFYGILRRTLSEIPQGSVVFTAMMAVLGAERWLFLPGARALLPDLLAACKRLVPTIQGTVPVDANLPDVQKSAYRLLAQMFTIKQHFEHNQMEVMEKDGEEEEFRLLERSLDIEESAELSNYMLNLLFSCGRLSSSRVVQRMRRAQDRPGECSIVGLGGVALLRHMTLTAKDFDELVALCDVVLERNDLEQEGKVLSALLELLVDLSDCADSDGKLDLVDVMSKALGFSLTKADDISPMKSSKKAKVYLRDRADRAVRGLETALRAHVEALLWKLLHRHQPRAESDCSRGERGKRFTLPALGVVVEVQVEDADEQYQVIMRIFNSAGNYAWSLKPIARLERDKVDYIDLAWTEDPKDTSIDTGDIYNDQNVNLGNFRVLSISDNKGENSPKTAVSVPQYRSPQVPMDPKRLPAMLLTHLGLDSHWRPSSDNDVQLSPSVYEWTVAVLFARSVRQTADAIYGERQMSRDYVAFLHGLGSISYATEHYRVDFRVPQTQLLAREENAKVPYELPSGYPVSQRTWEAHQYLQAAQVAIVWAEEAGDAPALTALPQKLSLMHCPWYVVVTPRQEHLSDGLYVVRVLVASEDADVRLCFGPLVDGAIVRRSDLVSLVRATVVSMLYFLDSSHPVIKRMQQLKALMVGDEREGEEADVHASGLLSARMRAATLAAAPPSKLLTAYL